jgi:DNA-binding winged helix-turn-helix (wHTH) protein/tetratricopeptide (TPR) repeat protein
MPKVLHFDCFEVDLAAARLFKRGARMRLREQSFQVLALLLERPGEVVSRDDLRRRLWPTDVFIDFENSLNTAVARLREALGDSAERPRFVETLPRHGYRFVGAILDAASAPGPARMRPSGAGAVVPAVVRKRLSRDPIACSECDQGLRLLDRMTGLLTGSDEARAHLEEAVARDPGFALAHEALAQMYWMLGYTGFMPPRDAFASGILHAVRALEIDHTSAEARALVAQYYKQLDYNWPDIERELSGALELNPASPLVRMLYAVSWLMPQGRTGEAIAELERALEWAPLSFQIQFWLTVMIGLSRDYDRLIAQSRLLIELEPASVVGHWQLMAGLRGKGMIEEATASQRKAAELSGGAPIMVGWLGLTLGASGRVDEARGVLERLETMARTRYVAPSMFAWTYLGLRDLDRAFEWLDRAVEARDQIMMPIKSYVFFDPLRADPRFHALLRKMKLE